VTTTRQQPAAAHVAAGFDPVSFTAISADEFWLLGAEPCAHPVCSSIVRTTDGGRHFVPIPAPHAAVSIGGDSSTSIDTLRFATALDGFAFDAQSFRRGDGASNPIWQTTDGGAHWRKADLQHVLAFATGGGFAYVVTGRCRDGACRDLILRRLRLGTSSGRSTALPVVPVDGLVELAAHGASLWLSLTPTAGNDPYQVLLASTDSG
jgi:hypothetical protein